VTITTYIFGIVSVLIALALVVELLRRGRLRERHAIWWLGAGVLALIASVFPQTVLWAAALLGIEVPVNLVFFVSIAILVIVCLQASSELTLLEARTRVLAERVALLEERDRQRTSGGDDEGPSTRT
jgi:hypothetical protein